MDKILRRPKFKIGLETIEFQSNDFGNKLEALMVHIKDYYELNPSSPAKAASLLEESKEIEALVFKRLGMKIKLITSNLLAAILPFYSNKNHIFLNEYFRGDFEIATQEKVLKEINNKKGTVDLKNAKLGGIFSEYENPVYMNFKELFTYYRLTPAEVTAVFLHELGHGFEVCEYADRLDTNNQILVDISKRIRDKKDNDLEYIYKEVKKIDKNYTLQETENLVNGNRVIGSVTWYQLIIKASGHEVKSQSSNDKYDDTSFETLADNFCNRFGYGRQIITGLDKLYKMGWSPEKSKSAFIYTQMMQILYSGILIAGMITGGLALAVFFGFLLFLQITTAGEAMKDYTYDELKYRYSRIRNDLVEFLKDQELDKSKVKDILANISITDKIINETNNHRLILNHFANFFFPGSRAANKSIHYQRLLEELASNDLFMKSAQLKTL